MRNTPTFSPSPGTPANVAQPSSAGFHRQVEVHLRLTTEPSRGRLGHMLKLWLPFFVGGVSIGYLSFAGGCASSATTQPSSVTQRQDQALHDPFGYTPDAKSSDLTVSGHGEGFDKKGFDRDTNSVLNP